MITLELFKTEQMKRMKNSSPINHKEFAEDLLEALKGVMELFQERDDNLIKMTSEKTYKSIIKARAILKKAE